MVRLYDGLPYLVTWLDRQRDTNNTVWLMRLWHKSDNRSNFDEFLVDTYASWVSRLDEMFENAWFFNFAIDGTMGYLIYTHD